MKTLNEKIKENLNPVDQDEYYNMALDNAYGEVSIAGMPFDTSTSFKQLDPIAYNCGQADFFSEDNNFYYNELDGEYYHQHEVDELEDEE